MRILLLAKQISIYASIQASSDRQMSAVDYGLYFAGAGGCVLRLGTTLFAIL